MLRKWGSVVAAAAMFASSTVAVAGADAQQQGALAPGDAAGVQRAAGLDSDTTMTLFTVTFFAGTLCLIFCGKDKNNTAAATTTSGP